jgi:polar amino acid transport system substrate-binding protein
MGAGAQGRQYPGAVSPTRGKQRSALVAGLMFGALGVIGAHAGGEKELLAPTGQLRIGVYLGSPTSMVSDARSGQTHGLTYDLGREFAARLGTPLQYLTFPRIADVIDAMKQGQIDFTITNATPARANDVGFSKPLLSIELGFLVPANSSIGGADAIDRSGVRLGVTKGGTSERVLSAKYKNAKIIPAESVKLAIEMLRNGELDAYATNKAILSEMSDALPGAQILDGNWGMEHMAIAIPKGREQALPFVEGFAREVQAGGLLEQVQRDAGLRGAVKAKP